MTAKRPAAVVLALALVAAGTAVLLVGCDEVTPDTEPGFGAQTVADQAYTVGEAIASLVLPGASGGNPPLTYSLTPAVPGLSFSPSTRTLSGAPTAAGDYAMTYRVEDSDGDAATLRFDVLVNPTPVVDAEPSFGPRTVADQTYTVGVSIASLVLPEASGGNPPLTYSLTPAVPGAVVLPEHAHAERHADRGGRRHSRDDVPRGRRRRRRGEADLCRAGRPSTGGHRAEFRPADGSRSDLHDRRVDRLAGAA